MIPAPSAEFLAQEARRTGVQPVVRFSLWPHFYLAGMDAGSFTECASAGPEKIVADWGGASPQWESQALEESHGEFPAQATPSWSLEPTAYDILVYFRTAATEAALALAAWQELAQGVPVSLEVWRQFKAVWQALRCWALLAEQPDNPLQAYATTGPGHPYLSYAVPGLGAASYLEKLRLLGELALDPELTLDGGELSLDKPLDFGDLVAADHQCALANVDGRFDFDGPIFLFTGNLPWYGKHLCIDYGYELPGGRREYVRLYRGFITDWELVEGGEVPKVIIGSRDYVARLLERPLGEAGPAGEEQPVICGEILTEAQEIKDRCYHQDPDHTAGFETGSLVELSGASTSGGGSLTAQADAAAHGGGWVLRAQTSGSGQKAQGRLDLKAGGSRLLFVSQIRVVNMPADPADRKVRFLGLLEAGGADYVSLYAGADGLVSLKRHDTGAWEQTAWNLLQHQGAWRRVSLGCVRENPGDLKVWVDGDEVLSLGVGNLSGKLTGGWVGLDCGAAESWTLDFDDLELYADCRFQSFLVPGGPFEAISAVYTDGVLVPVLQAAGRGRRRGKPRLARKLRGGKKADLGRYSVYPAYGLIDFPDLNSPPEGTVMARVRKNNIKNPVDVIEYLFTEAGLAPYLDAASFAAARTATSADLVGCRFADTTVGDALQEICQKCLLDLWMDQGLVFLKAYTGQGPGGPVLTLSAADYANLRRNARQDGLVTRLVARYGWYEGNQALSYEAEDPDLAELIGENLLEVSWEWGEAVATENAEMVRCKTNWLFQRLAAPMVETELDGFHPLIRLELGEAVALGGNDHEICGKSVRLGPERGVSLRLARWLGEA